MKDITMKDERIKRREDILEYMRIIDVEIARQQQKWGIQSHTNEKWYRILGEEFGEVARCINDGNLDNLDEELVQCAAVIISWLIDRERGDK